MPHTCRPTLASGGTPLFPTNAPEGPWQPAPMRGRCSWDGAQPSWLPKAFFLMRRASDMHRVKLHVSKDIPVSLEWTLAAVLEN